MGIARLHEGAADEGDVVARAAAAAGLRHDDGEPIRVVLPGENGVHDLSDDGNGGIAGVVVDVLEPHVDGAAVVVVEHDHAVSVPPEHRLEHVEVDGAHLRREDRIARALHGGGILRTAVRPDGGRRGGGGLLRAHVHRGEEAPDADAHRAEVRHLVDFQQGIELARALEQLADLIGRDGVEPAAEGVELNELQIPPPRDKLRRGVEP